MSVYIDKIIFKNYRQYGSGVLRFDTKNDIKLSVFVAKNGTGKTTLLNAITWCLYGEEKQLDQNETPLPLVNTAILQKANIDDVIPVCVKVEVIDDDRMIEFCRETKFKITPQRKPISDSDKFSAIITPRDGILNTMVKDDEEAEDLVKEYFDEAIYQFYFFDGENLKEFFTANKTSYIKDSIFNISQVTLIKNSCEHLDKLKKDYTKKLSKDYPVVAELEKKCNNLEKNIQRRHELINESKKRIKSYENDTRQVEEKLKVYGPIQDKQTRREVLENRLKKIEEDAKELGTQYTTFIRKYMILLSLYPRISQTLSMIKEKEDKGELPPSIDKKQIENLLDHCDEPCPLCGGKIGETGRQHLADLLKKISVSSETSNYLKEIKGSLEADIDEAKKFNLNLEKIKECKKDLEGQKNDITKELNEISSYLSNYNSTDATVDIPKLESRRRDLKSNIALANQNIGSNKAELNQEEKELDALKEELSLAIEKTDERNELKRMVKIIETICEGLEQIKDKIVNEMKSEIEKTTWNYFDHMIWKKETFGSIEISDNYDVSVYDKNHNEMTGSLSATEKMALAYAFTLAIHKTSGKNCPLVIDSPLGRVSDDNRENMAKALLDVSRDKQIIMLFTPDEYSSSVQKLYQSSANVRELKLSSDESFIEGIEC